MPPVASEIELPTPGAQMFVEGGVHYIFFPGLPMPVGCSPTTVDALLCLDSVAGYSSRLYFAQQIAKDGTALNWNGSTHILGRNWVAYSWKDVSGSQHPMGVLSAHLDALR